MASTQTIELQPAVELTPVSRCDLPRRPQTVSAGSGRPSTARSRDPDRPSSADNQPPTPRTGRVFRAIEPIVIPPVSQGLRFLIALLIIFANLIQFTSNFITISAGLSLSKLLGRDVGPGQANWMAASYSLTQGAFVLITGRLGAVYGHQKLTLIGLFIFALGSLVNGFCRSYESFIAIRALTGVGGGVFMPNAVTILTLMVPPGPARNVLLGLFAASPPIGGVIGALAAGLCANAGGLWSYTGLFAVIAATSAACMALLWLVLPREEPVDKHGSIDYVGAALGLGSLLLYNIAWNQAPSVGWSTPYEIAILVLAVACFCAFLYWEKSWARDPIMPLDVFRTPTFLALIFVVLLSYMAFGITLWYSIAWQQTLRNISVMQTGVNFVPFGVGSVASVALAAYMLPRVAAQWIMAIGVAVVLASSLLLATMPIDQSYWFQTFPAMVLSSFCPDFVYLAAQIIASNSVSRRHQGVASSLVGTLNLYGNSLGLGFAGTIETEVTKKLAAGSSAAESVADTVSGYRAALYFAAGIAFLGLVLDFAFVRVPKNEREGWDEELEDHSAPEPQLGAVLAAEATAVDRQTLA
ncbi:hypothetical protein PCL_05024 [Purpureocillium lilacinum]|uniref:Major facilitator superfamily (MFS) profile domain-containing protein n=1 Tax=Purpureocillium lilacinum TaxID=33203 RepID=A0A2U3DWH0_PURLI|nr:hypothetical protein PCL_05024 [Purpureocillium lilacinum]